MKGKIIFNIIVFLVLINFVNGSLQDLNATLAHCWSYEDDNSTQIDSQGNADGTLNGADFTTSGFLGNAYDYNVESDFIDYGDIDVLTDQTYTIWVNLTDTAEGAIISKWGSGTAQHAIYFLGSNPVSFAPSTWQNMADLTDITSWHHLAIVKDGSQISFFLDGVNSTFSYSSSWSDDGASLLTGALTDAGANGLNAVIDEFKLYNTALNSSAILEDYNSGMGLSCSDIIEIEVVLINVTLDFPQNNTNQNNITMPFIFNITSDVLVNCTLNLNGIANNSILNLNSTSNPINIINVTGLIDTTYNWTIECNGSGISDKPTEIIFTYDTILPNWIIRTIQTDNSTIFDRSSIFQIQFNDTVNDTNLFGVNITVNFPNGSVWFSNETINITDTTFNYTRLENITTEQPNGTYTINYYAEDDSGGLNIVNETYTFKIKENIAPVLNATLPTGNFSADDGTNVNFQTNTTDEDNDIITYEYFFNGIIINNSQNWTWTIPFSSHGINNITVIFTDAPGKNGSFTWIINITHLNIKPNVTSIIRSPTTAWFSNTLNAQFNCSGLDGDNETAPINWTVEIDYRTGFFWTSLTPVFDTGQIWKALINLTTLEGETLDVRCKISDGEEFSDYLQENNIVTIQEAYFVIGNVSVILPNGGNRDFVISVTCSPKSFGSVRSYNLRYDFDAFYNGEWHNLSYNLFNKALFDMTKINYSETVQFRCRINDSTTTTPFVNGNPVTRTHINNLFMFDRGNDEVIKAKKPYAKGLYADFYNEQNITIIASFADCNGDGYWDYYFSYNDTRNTTKEHFLCINPPGIIKHTVGVLINKTGRNDLFCGTKMNGFCKIQRTYGVLVK